MKLFFFLLCALYFAQCSDPSYPYSAGSITVSSVEVCPAYICQAQSIKTGCATYSGSQMLMEGCMGDWYCSWDSSPDSDNLYQFGKCKLRRQDSKFRKNFGDFCYQNEDCKSSYCVLNRCNVKAQGAACTSTYQCGKGLTCDSYTDTCKAWLLDGASCTDTNKYLCKPNSGCLTKVGGTATCTQFYSVATDQLSYAYERFFSIPLRDYCSSGSITSSSTCASSSYTLAGGYPKTCNSALDCPAAGDAAMYSSCMCWPNTEGVNYCSPFVGDVIATFNRQKAWMTKDFSKCYNYEIGYGMNDCGGYDLNKDRDWAPQMKAKTWGSCYDSVGLTVQHSVSTYNNACPAIKCNSGNNDEGRCLKYIEGSRMFYAQSCPGDYICGSTYTGRYSLYTADIPCIYGHVRHSKGKKGGWCWVDDDCYSGVCEVTKTCGHLSLGTVCVSSSNCGKKMICAYSSASSNSICQNWIDIGGACTSETKDLCREGLVCLASSAGVTSGTCQAKYSLGSGETSYVMGSTGSVQYGSSSYCKSGAWDSSSNSCFGTPHKLSSYPKTCTDTVNDCQSTNSKDSQKAYSSCSCLPNTQGQKYCMVFAADIDSNYYNYMYTYYSRDLSDCYAYEIGNNYGGACGVEDKYLDYWAHSIPSQYFPSCGRDILYDSSRYNNNEDEDLIYLWVFSTKLFTTVCLLLGILLFK